MKNSSAIQPSGHFLFFLLVLHLALLTPVSSFLLAASSTTTTRSKLRGDFRYSQPQQNERRLAVGESQPCLPLSLSPCADCHGRPQAM
jgi:hypothetical protein